MDKVIKSYSMKINKKSKSKLFYYLRRDLIGYGKDGRADERRQR